ncbi:hypothetical protein Rwratislav_46965 [Rhodococcus wratislaviensis IFP 2016]|nr:hypothetical protein Rwratislav_46965 [Rhodococcus wratislaviensis IFP 2016]
MVRRACSAPPAPRGRIEPREHDPLDGPGASSGLDVNGFDGVDVESELIAEDGEKVATRTGTTTSSRGSLFHTRDGTTGSRDPLNHTSPEGRLRSPTGHRGAGEHAGTPYAVSIWH